MDLENTMEIVPNNIDVVIENSLAERLRMDLEFLLYDVYWGEIGLFIIFVIIGFVLDQKFDIKRPRKWFLACNGLIFQRFCAMLAFYVPYIDLMNTLIPPIQVTHPFLVRLVMPDFIVDSMEFLQQIPFLSLVYLGITYGCLIRYRRPDDRFVRFNIMYSIIIMSLLGIFQEIFLEIIQHIIKDPEDKAEFSLLMYIVWVAMVFGPCFGNAFLGRYTPNTFIREAVEIHLGRDSVDFVWWDRRGDKDDKRPKKPKKPRKPKK